MFDAADIGDGERPNDPIVMSVWESETPIEDATELFWTPVEAEGKPWGAARIALAIGNPDWRTELERLAEQHLARS